MFSSLAQYVSHLKKHNLLTEIETQVDPFFEAGEIASRVVANGGPALLFKNIKGSPYPLLMNAFGSERLLCHALSAASLSELKKRGETVFGQGLLLAKTPFSAAFKTLPTLGYFPITVPEPSDLVAEKPDLSKLPVLKTYPLDGGRFITMGITVLSDPETGAQNVGLYRLQVLGDGRLGLHFHKNKDASKILEKWKNRGEKMPVAVVVGCDPAVLYSASAPTPQFLDEFRLAGLLNGRPLKLRKCRTVPLLVPAQSEFVLEGYCNPQETVIEGPFGDHTGYYSAAEPHAVFTPALLVRKENPIFWATVTGKPIKEDYFLGLATEKLFLPAIKLLCPEIHGIHFFPEGVFHGCLTVSVNESSFGAVQKVFNFIWGMGQLCTSKLIIAVDKSVDIENVSEVLWRVFNNVDFKRDVCVSKGFLDDLDTASPTVKGEAKSGTKIGIDATQKWHGDGQTEAAVPPEIIQKVTKRWREYGLEF